ncbi:hypothetical protein [Acetivibrio straminisolvens]|jgi:ABC-type bacteriocin/lantibiotic exporter with double-glycine peptidase domain|uniref:Uncharacterized protein n=1 Tax=Acetivibrio straminisolvens JCM 21531 TaxID=1294263 RepID=W4VDE9_9FIRM|nr:hypothetical protein [Acetivibrio straminisolvens]GAE90784.1 hypothetical protein JCM21531_4423 [Acetivibrio straminisolvens JCM 21531]
MQNNTVKSVITIIVAIILLVIAVKLVSWLAYTLLPIAIVIIAAYIVYKFVIERKK